MCSTTLDVFKSFVKSDEIDQAETELANLEFIVDNLNDLLIDSKYRPFTRASYDCLMASGLCNGLKDQHTQKDLVTRANQIKKTLNVYILEEKVKLLNLKMNRVIFNDMADYYFSNIIDFVINKNPKREQLCYGGAEKLNPIQKKEIKIALLGWVLPEKLKEILDR